MRRLLFAAVLATASLAGCAKTEKTEKSATAAKVPEMTVDELDAALAAKQATPVDCNGDGTRRRMGVIPGAILIADEDKFPASDLPADKAAKLVFYCGGPG